jgi:ActD protein
MRPVGLYGLMAEFENPGDLVAAAREAREAGYVKLDAYTPYPIEALTEALDIHDRKLPALVLAFGILGGLAGYGLCYWTSVIAYPLVIGGKPLHSAPAFIVPTFETTILFAAFAAVLGMLGLNGLPMPYHPVFNTPRFALASRDRFFLCIEATDPKFDRYATESFLKDLHPVGVSAVEP